MPLLNYLQQIQFVSKMLPCYVLIVKHVVVLHHVPEFSPLLGDNGFLLDSFFSPLISNILNSLFVMRVVHKHTRLFVRGRVVAVDAPFHHSVCLLLQPHLG